MVKIQLENFLCHQDSVFELGENGLSLISGRSGKGKTSILKGIFSLYSVLEVNYRHTVRNRLKSLCNLKI